MPPPLKIVNWRKGVTDDYVDASPMHSRRLYNFMLTREGKPKQRPGIEIYNSSAPQLPSGNQKVDGLYYFSGTLFAKSGTKLYYLRDGATSWTTLSTIAGKDAFKDSEVGAGWSVSEWRGHLFITPGPGSTKLSGCRSIAVYKTDSTTWACTQMGLPRASAAARTGTTADGSGSDNWIAYNMFKRTYNAYVNGVSCQFQEFSEPEETQYSYQDITDNLTWEGGFNLVNGTDDNYDDASTLVVSYRTKVGDVTPLYSDIFNQSTNITYYQTTDAELGAEAYFAGGVEYWDPPPKAHGSLVIGGTSFFFAGIDIDDTNQFHPGRCWQSDPAYPKGVPSGNYVDVAGKACGWGRAGSNPVVLTEDNAVRLEGRYDKFGGGGMVTRRISSTEGCVSYRGVVEGEGGLFFPSRNGWCFTDGYQVVKLAKHLRETYKALYSKSGMSACFDSKNRRVFWSCEDRTVDSTNTGNPNCLYVLDLNHTEGEEGCFAVWKAGANLSATALHYDSENDRVIIGDRRGYVMVFDGTKTVDLTVDTATAYSTWGRSPIVWDWYSAAHSFGSSLLTKICQRWHIVAKNVSASFSADVASVVDDSTTAYSSTEVRDRSAATVGLHKVWRWFKKASLRCRYREVRLTKGYVNLFRSDDYATATVNSAAKTVLLGSGTWPEDSTYDLRGHYIAFAGDDYVAEYLITVDSGNTLTLSTAPAGNPAGTGWVIRGYPKGESCQLEAVEIEYEVEEMTTPGFRAGEGNANG